MLETKQAENILVIQPLPGIGDMIWHLPHLQAIANTARNRKITILTKPKTRADTLFKDTDYVKEILWLDPARGGHGGPLGGFRLGDMLKPYGFDTCWILHNSARYGLAAARAGIPSRFGYGINWQNMFLTSPYTLTRRDQYLKTNYKASALLERNGIDLGDPVPRLAVAQSSIDATTEQFKDWPRPWFVLGIGASQKFKSWSPERFAQLTDELAAETGGTFFLPGGPNEQHLVDHITQKNTVPLLGSELSLVAELCSSADMFIGNDSGMMNIAAAVGCTTIGLFGGTDLLDEFPELISVTPEGRVTHGKSRMDDISVETVLAKSLGALNRTGG